MMLNELDYKLEFESLNHIRQLLKDQIEFIVPRPIEELSSSKVLAMTFEPSYRIDSPQVLNLSQEERNDLAKSYLWLYFKELFDFSFVQTDPHIGNYGVKIYEGESPKLVLYDYGAVKKIPSHFFSAYKKIILGSIQQNRATLLDGALTLGLIKENDSSQLIEKYVQLCFLFTEPFWKGDFNSPTRPLFFDIYGNYNFANSDLPNRIAEAGKSIVLNFKFRTPPKELVFLDRKMGGTFTFLSTLKANINGREIFDKITDPQ
jgi:hypothetical protein